MVEELSVKKIIDKKGFKKTNPTETILYQIERSDKLIIIIKFLLYKKWKYLDIRHFFKNDSGMWLPTTKGIRIPIDLLEELKEGIDKAYQDWSNSLPGATEETDIEGI